MKMKPLLYQLPLPLASFALLLSLVASGISISAQRSQFALGIVDTNAIISLQAQGLAKLYPQGQIPPEKLKSISDHLKEMITQWAMNKGVILVAKGAVWGGSLTDYTQSLVHDLNLGEG